MPAGVIVCAVRVAKILIHFALRKTREVLDAFRIKAKLTSVLAVTATLHSTHLSRVLTLLNEAALG